MRWRILVADDHPLFRRGVVEFLKSMPRSAFEVVGEASSSKETVEMVRRLRPDVVLLDIYMPEGGGLQALRRIREEAPSTAVIILSVSESDEYLMEAVRLGARGYLLKDLEPEQLAAALEHVVEGGAALAPAMAARLIGHYRRAGDATSGGPAHSSRCDRLTHRELEVLRLVALGMTNREIARRLFVSENTVKNHLRNIMEKLGVKNRVQLALYGAREGLLQAS